MLTTFKVIFTDSVLPDSETVVIAATGVFRPLVATGVLLPLLAALPNWLLLPTSRIHSSAAPLEDEGKEATPEIPGGENINEATSSLDEDDDDDMLASWLEEVDWRRLVLLNATRALAGEKNIAIL
jgi:hypothetical protein